MIAENAEYKVKRSTDMAKEALNNSNILDYTVPLSGQLSTNPNNFSMPATGIALVHPRTGTVDLYFASVVEGAPNSRTASYNYLTLKDFCTEIGCSGLKINGYSTVVTLIRNNMDQGICGRAGLKWNAYQNSQTDGGIARVYGEDLKIVGTWSLSDGAPNYYVIQYRDVYTFAIVGAKMI